MYSFEEYIRQGEPNKAEKAKDWKTAIGLQQVDGLKPSDYLIETARQNIEGEITIEEVNNDLFAEHSWYFRNALVRADYENLSKGIHKTDIYLIRFLLNLLHQENYLLKNREMHVHYVPLVNDTVKTQNDNDTETE